MTTAKKLTSTLNYISKNISSALAIDLQKRISRATSLDLSDDTFNSLLDGISTSGAGIFVSNGDARRQALRALLLCQKVYLTKISQRYDFIEISIPNWPKVTINYWKAKTESQICEAIRIYMPLPNASPDALINAATIAPPVADLVLTKSLYKLTRNDIPFPTEGICYRAIQSWLLVSGYVSLQWFILNSDTSVSGVQTDSNCTATKLLGMFGPGLKIDVTDDANKAITMRGDVVYMYRSNKDGSPRAGGQLGHWMLSEGNTFGYGCNNFTQDEALGTAGVYARASIINQIKAMQRGSIIPNVKDWHFVRVYKPSNFEKFPSE